MADSRRVIYFTNGGWQLVVVDTVTKTRTVVPLRLPAPSTIDMFAISPDNRHIYYGGAQGGGGHLDPGEEVERGARRGPRADARIRT